MTLKICKKRQSILDSARHGLVLGGPGSGKTTLALLKAVRRTENGLSSGQEILFLSFSRAAVARITEAAGKQNIPESIKSTISIQTFHSFFWQLIKAHGYLLGAPRKLSILLPHDESALSDGMEWDDPNWKAWQATRWEMFKSSGLVCFDLFAPLAVALLRQSAKIRHRISMRYPLILVDEAQDTGDEQWGCVRLLSQESQIVCLADPNQMIYDFLPGVGSERIAGIREALTPLEIDLESENNRSPNTDIAAFARDILTGKVREGPYRGVSYVPFRADAKSRDAAIRSSVGMLAKRILEETKKRPESLAILASYSRGVAIISAALQNGGPKGKPIEHRVFFDEAFSLLSSRAIAFLLEPKEDSKHAEDVATLLELAASAFRSKGTKTALAQSKKYSQYAVQCRQGKLPKYKAVAAADTLVQSARTRKLLGEPRQDWIAVKQELRNAGDASFVQMAGALDYLVAFRRGNRIAMNLSELWLKYGFYQGARDALNDALTQEQLVLASEQTFGTHVMNMHKCKGKQFDGVVLYRQQYTSPFVWYEESAPFARSRRLLHMAIARAKSHVLILDEVVSQCPILDPYTLR
ncbi:MAG: UvrD-helicase domain-containing protein [Phycisphaerae bacterium]